MRALKALVIGMGILIVAGVVVLAVVAVERAGGGDNTAAFAPATVDLPPGAEIVETRLGDGRIVVRLRLADGGGRLLVIDAATGRLAGIVDLRRK